MSAEPGDAAALWRRGPNENFIIGSPSTMNRASWWSKGFHKLPVDSLPSIVSDFGTAGPLAVAACSVAGAKHRFAGSANQDAYALQPPTAESSVLCVAVCDGVSSARHSAIGARVLSSIVVRSLSDLFADGVPGDITEARRRVRLSLAGANSVLGSLTHDQLGMMAPPVSGELTGHLDSTIALAVIAVAPQESGQYPAIVAAVGDSPAYTLTGARFSPVTTIAQDAVIVETATAALPTANDDFAFSLQHVLLDPGSALVLVSDGIGSSLMDGDSDLGRFLANHWKSPSPEPRFRGTFIDTTDFDRRGEDDDRTAVLVWVPPFLDASVDGVGAEVGTHANPVSREIR